VDNYANDSAIINDNDYNSLGDSKLSFDDIQSKIDKAQDGSTIELNGTYYGNGKAININKNLKIVGIDETILDACGKSNVFDITADDVSLTNLIIINSNGTHSGAIYSEGDLRLYNCYFKNNIANLNKIYQDDESSYIWEGGLGGAIYSTGDDLLCDNCTFINNTALTALNSEYEFDGGVGGAIYSEGDLSIIGCNFTDNHAPISGGAIFGAIVEIYSSVFTNNYVDTALATCIDDEGNEFNITEGGFGGAVSAFDYLICDDSTFINNYALTKDEDGGIAGALYSSGDMTLINDKFISNHADLMAGAILCCDNEDEETVIKSKLTISDCIFEDNYIGPKFDENTEYEPLGGGAIVIVSTGSNTITNSNFTNNKANGVFILIEGEGIGQLISDDNDTGVINNGPAGGAIYSITNLKCDNCNFIRNHAFTGGAICVVSEDNSIVTISKSNFYDNNASDCGGAVCIQGNGKISECNLINNPSKYGQVIYEDGYDFTFNNNYWGSVYNPNKADLQKFANDLHVIFASADFDFYSKVPTTWYNDKIENKPVKQSFYSLTLYVSKGTYADGKTCYVTMNNGNGGAYGEQVTFMIYKSGKLYKSVSTTIKKDGKAYLPVKLPVATYTIKVFYPDNNTYTPTKTYVVAKAKGTLSASSISVTYKEDKYFKIKLVNYASKNPVAGEKITIKLYKGKKLYKTYAGTTDSEGLLYLGTKSLPVYSYTVKVSISNSNIAASTISRTIKVNKIKATISASSISTYYKSGKKLSINLYKTANKDPLKSVKLTVKLYKGKKLYKTYYVTTNSKGVATLSLSSLPVYSYTAKISLSSSTMSASTISRTVKISKIKASLTADSISTYYKSGKKMYITLKDTNNNVLLKSKKLTIKVYKGSKLYKTYYATTNSKGVASFNTNNLATGTFTVKVYYSTSTIAASTISKTIKITKNPNAKVSASNLTAKKGTNSYFKLTVKTPDSKLLSSATVKITAYDENGTVLWSPSTVKTSSKGIAQFNTKSLAKGTYYIKISVSSTYYTGTLSGKVIEII
ncbi:MAG: hypothetical protein MJ224_06790, partial [archaeon]|nr:hypothetical protein [archaeon]